MNKITRQTMVDYVTNEANRGSIYVWGAQGQRGYEISEAWIKKMETSTANANRAITTWKRNCQKYDKLRIGAFDCSGLIGACLNENGNPSFDDTANGYLGRCVAITKDKLQPGDLVFEYANGKSGHVGVYVGNGYVVEARGRDYGVVKTALDARNWKKYGRPDFMYIDANKAESVSKPVSTPTPTPTPAVATKPSKYAYTLPDGLLYYGMKVNQRVYLRLAPHTFNTIITTLDAGTAIRYRGEHETYYFVSVDGTGQKGFVAKSYIGNKYLPKSDGVKAIQERLGVTVDGIYGANTAKAVGKFQESVGLTNDCIYGPNTKKALEAR